MTMPSDDEVDAFSPDERARQIEDSLIQARACARILAVHLKIADRPDLAAEVDTIYRRITDRLQ